ncbi:hypothetical protein U1Q18_035989 [Sarracenia purpurea var. burkii]
MSCVEEMKRDKGTTTIVRSPSFGLEVGFTQDVEDEVPEGGKRSEATIVSFIGEGSSSPTSKKSLTKLSQIPYDAPIHADEDEGDQDEESIQQNVEESQDDDPDEEEIDLLTLKRNFLVSDKVMVENEIQIIDEVQSARVDKGKGIANLEPTDKPQVSQSFYPSVFQHQGGGRSGPGGRGGRFGSRGGRHGIDLSVWKEKSKRMKAVEEKQEWEYVGKAKGTTNEKSQTKFPSSTTGPTSPIKNL